MANWVTHLRIADRVLERCPQLEKRGFCVGNIAPDCNVENEDWTDFTPPRAVTHWMKGERKKASDCDGFYEEYIVRRKEEIKSKEQYCFLLGYYSHLITDAAFQAFIRDEQRVKASWERLKAREELQLKIEMLKEEKGEAFEENWDFFKMLVPKKERMHELFSMEAEYLRDNPESGFLTEILSLKEFPDYIDYLPKGSVVRKIGIMGVVPGLDETMKNPVGMSREEFESFAINTTELVIKVFSDRNLLVNGLLYEE